MLFQVGRADVYFYFFGHLLFVGHKEIEIVFKDIVYAFEVGTLVDRPTEWTYLNLQFLFNFVK